MIHFRCLTPDDAIIFRNLRLEALKVAPSAFGNSYETEIAYPLTVFESRLINTDDRFTVGGFVDDQLVASCTFSRFSSPYMKHKGKIMALYCQPAHQRQQIGYQLVTILLKKVKQLEGVKVCQLSVVSTNLVAIKLYEKLGFSCYGHEEKALYDGKNFRDEYHYQLLIDRA